MLKKQNPKKNFLKKKKKNSIQLSYIFFIIFSIFLRFIFASKMLIKLNENISKKRGKTINIAEKVKNYF